MLLQEDLWKTQMICKVRFSRKKIAIGSRMCCVIKSDISSVKPAYFIGLHSFLYGF